MVVIHFLPFNADAEPLDGTGPESIDYTSCTQIVKMIYQMLLHAACHHKARSVWPYNNAERGYQTGAEEPDMNVSSNLDTFYTCMCACLA